MSTAMQKWIETKKNVVMESTRVIACLREAMVIIKKTTGQNMLNPVTFGGEIKVVMASHSTGDYVKLYVDYVSQYAEDFNPEKHWSGTLQDYQTLVEILKGINTGDVISAWESQQE